MVRAYEWMRGFTDDPGISFAAVLASNVKMKAERQLIESLLLCHDYTCEKAAAATGLSPDALWMYEQLFFNVRDRYNESTLLASYVYDQTRLVEVVDGYIAYENFQKILQRTGYNNGMAYVLNLAGTPNGRAALNTLSLRDTKEKLELEFMRNGLLMVSSGFINQRINAAGVQRAQALISAGKMGGNEPEQTGTGMFDNDMSAAVFANLRTTKRADASEAQRVLIAGSVDRN